MNAKFHPENTPCQDRPASHKKPAVTYLQLFYLVRQRVGAESCNFAKSKVIRTVVS